VNLWLSIPSVALLMAAPILAVTPESQELEACRQWGEQTFSSSGITAAHAPLADPGKHNPYGFSFLYKGAPSAALLGGWSRQFRETSLDAHRTRREIIYKDSATGLEVRAEATLFSDFPAVEWLVYLKNTSQVDTPELDAIQALDMALPAPKSSRSILHSARGALATFDDFAPQETVLKKGDTFRLESGGGRSSSQTLPFFNVEGDNGGVIAVVGWSGTWTADFAGGSDGQVAMKCGIARTHLVLHPGETIRTPRMLLLFYHGNQWRGQNLLRQFLLAHHRPNRNGEPLVAPITCGNWGGTRAEVHLDNIEQIVRHQLPIEYYWIDAEWFGKGSWYPNAGNWEVKKDLYPNGFKPLSDALRKSEHELMLWFEPERVVKDTAWYKEHHEWLIDTGDNICLFNLGNPDARKFLTDFISAKIDEFGLGCYRQDFNMDPLSYWQSADAPNRQGITEIRYIEGLYAFWDELLARHPGLIIDNCASGGRRIDLETVGRATPFWRSDGPRDPVAHQCHTEGLLAWVPLSATSQDRAGDNYEFRSSMCSGLCLNWWVSGDVPSERIPANFPFAWAKGTLEQYLKLRHFYYSDYYPLTTYGQSKDTWLAYELNRPDAGQGLIVALRRPESPYQTARLVLRGLEENAAYRVTNIDTGESKTIAGAELVRDGLLTELKAKPDSGLFLYERQ
jgi:alpha-galactosidase